MRLYHYTSLENFWKIWVTKELLFSKSHVPSNNDYFERRKTFSVSENNCENFIINVLMNQNKNNVPNVFFQLNKYKQISLIKDYKDGTLGCLSPMMWGQYADRGRGVCIEIDTLSLENNWADIWAGDVEYVDELECFKIEEKDLESIETVNNAIRKQKNILFFQKHKHWEIENEYRLISNKISALDISKAIKKIIVSDYDSHTSMLVQKLVKNCNMLYYLMAEEINRHKKLNLFPFPSIK